MRRLVLACAFLASLFLSTTGSAGNPPAGDHLPAGAVTRYGTEDLRDPVANKVLYLPDGKTMVSAGWTLRVWDVATRKMTAEYPIPGGYASYLSCSAKGDRLYLACTQFLVLNAADGKVLATVERPEAGWASTAVSPAGNLLAVGGYKGEILLWELPSGKPVPFKGKHEYADDSPLKDKHFLPVGSLSFHPTKLLLASGGRDHAARVWDLTTGAEVHTFTGTMGNVLFTPDGKHLVTNDAFEAPGDPRSSSKLSFWNVATGKRDREIDATFGYDATWSPDGKHLVTGVGCCSVGVRDAGTGKLVFRSPELGTSVGGVSVAPDGNTFAAVSHGLDVRDLRTGRSLLQPDGHVGMIHDIKLSDDRARIATAGADTTIRLWDIKTGREVQKLQAKAGIYTLAFAPGEDVLLSGGPDGVTFWDLRKGAAVRAIPFEKTVQWIGFSPDRRAILVGCADLGVRVLDADSGKQLRTIGGYAGLGVYGKNCFLQSADGRYVVRPLAPGPGGDAGLVMEDVGTGREVRRFEALGERIVNGALSPDGAYFAHGGTEVALYDVAKKKKVGVVAVAWYGVMRFSPDSKHLYLGRDCYDVATRKKLFTLPADVECLEFDAQGKRAFTVNRARCSVLAWDLERPETFQKE